ncbi:hypothetical protein Tco_1166393 [Tanacetum coccineum]
MLFTKILFHKRNFLLKKYFSSSFMSSENPSNASSLFSPSETKPTVAPMPSANPVILDLNKIENDFKRLFTLLQLDSNMKLEENSENSIEIKRGKVEVSVRTNKKTYVASKNVVSNKKIVTDVDVKNALKAKDVLCVSCAKNVLILFHDKCLSNYKLNVHSKVRRALFTTPRTAKSKFKDTTPVVSKTRFSVKTTQSESLDTTSVVSPSNFDLPLVLPWQ